MFQSSKKTKIGKKSGPQSEFLYRTFLEIIFVSEKKENRFRIRDLASITVFFTDMFSLKYNRMSIRSNRWDQILREKNLPSKILIVK